MIDTTILELCYVFCDCDSDVVGGPQLYLRFLQAKSDSFVQYQKHVLANSKAVANSLMDNHLCSVNLKASKKLTQIATQERKKITFQLEISFLPYNVVKELKELATPFEHGK
ncbi:hypothetical protein THRCLA_22427 [Thraustotheca clavata]|uniref:Uncharacterized protein n=1 Tax=Thraustotheca clavata TaxID=74557 RepID=A0A1V9Z1K7_9STRA|nr:hypothetical protein THRCLA_22427 [Thraustotheca clavata]